MQTDEQRTIVRMLGAVLGDVIREVYDLWEREQVTEQ